MLARPGQLRRRACRGGRVWRGALVLSLVVGLPVAVAVQNEAPDGATFAAEDWPFIGGDWANSRYSTLDQINTETVADLGAVWRLPFEGGASTRATPVVKDGILYIGAGTLACTRLMRPRAKPSGRSGLTRTPRLTSIPPVSVTS